MLYHLLVPLADTHILFNVFRYTSFRMAWALITALGFCYVMYPPFIRWMNARKMAQIIRDDGPQEHLENKLGTPTMGGLPMLAGITLSCLLWCRLDQVVVWVSLVILVGYGVIGFIDDWKKVMERSSAGLSGRWKIVGQVTIGGGALAWAYLSGGMTAELPLPFFKDAIIDFAALWPGAPPALAWLYVAFGVFILVATSNGVNLTDGLDGLAIGPVMTSAMTYGILAYIAGHSVFSGYLSVLYVPGASELTIFCMAIVGAGLGFLWYNAYPAQIFMGDVGSLALGGGLGALAILSKQEILLALVGGIFVLETVSVILQVGSYKLRGKRIFAMAPIHHHYEKLGWSEPKIIVRFWIISILLALVALTTLKLR
ncbi:MAG: phospho-N-acetylmuramoyl-pentapeptide-transferase [Alphaproteobacteria bacterium]|nr:phospho-N-acetylmuramoyl-pentapeptide-transferase [Alphaproteobacteria bacterium]